MTTSATPASFLADPPLDEAVQQLYDRDLEGLGYVMNLSKVWAQSPDALTMMSDAMRMASDLSDLDADERALLVVATASTMGDAYCSLSFGAKLARVVGEEITARVVLGDDAQLTPHGRLLAAWARQVVRDPNATTADQVQALRAAGFEDRQIFGLTLFVALRVLFSTVNDALGASPDSALAASTPQAVVEAVDFGRPPSTTVHQTA